MKNRHVISLRKVIPIILLTLFLVSILTVESHQAEGRTLNDRCPTCVETTVVFAVGGHQAVSFEIHGLITFLSWPDSTFFCSLPVTSGDQYRSPPSAQLF
jgi:hypothetical protein